MDVFHDTEKVKCYLELIMDKALTEKIFDIFEIPEKVIVKQYPAFQKVISEIQSMEADSAYFRAQESLKKHRSKIRLIKCHSPIFWTMMQNGGRKMGNKVHELGLLLDEEVEMLMQEADCKSVSGESKSAAAGGAAAGAGAGAGGAAGAAASK